MSAIPYTDNARTDTGLYNAKVGTWLFLAAEAMFFGALFSSYVFLRTAADEWPKGMETLPMGLGAANVVVLALLGVASVASWTRAHRTGASGLLWVVAGLGVVSVALIAVEHRIVGGTGIRAATSTFYGMYYLLTGLIRFHVVGGVLVTAYLALTSRRMVKVNPVRFANRTQCLGHYWLFLGAVSLVTFVLLYIV